MDPRTGARTNRMSDDNGLCAALGDYDVITSRMEAFGPIVLHVEPPSARVRLQRRHHLRDQTEEKRPHGRRGRERQQDPHQSPQGHQSPRARDHELGDLPPLGAEHRPASSSPLRSVTCWAMTPWSPIAATSTAKP